MKYLIVGPPGSPPDWGINYVPTRGKTEKRAEKGDVIGDLPPSEFRDWLLVEGLIEEQQHG